jgi:gamma-glutamyltranspeptidase/glutathione hydrolase
MIGPSRAARLSLLLVLLAPTLGGVACSASSTKSRKTVTALYALETRSPYGAVSTGFVEATRAAVQMLEAGGNAVDAAVTAAFAAGSAAPGSSGLGGTTYILIHLEGGRAIAIDGSARVPLQVDRQELAELKDKDELFGCRTAAVPGTLAALEYALRTYGTKSLAETIAPAIEVAERGFVVTDSKRASINRYLDILRKAEYLRLILLKDGVDLPDVGTRIRLPDLAQTLKRIATHGVGDFYRGAIANQIAADMMQRGGYIRLADLGILRITVGPPLRTSYRGTEVITFPWPGGGGAVIEALNILETFSPEFLGQTSTDRLQAMVETFHIARQDHYRFTDGITDHDRHRTLPYTSKKFAADRAGLIRFDRALTNEDFAPAPQIYSPKSGTTQISVVDRFGNTVSLTQTLGRFYGGKAVTPGLGFVYNSFLEEYDHTNPSVMQPRSAPTTDMSPTIVLRDGKLLMALGSAGSERIPGVVAQVISNVVDGNLGVRDAVLAPRALWNGSDEPGVCAEQIRPITKRQIAELERRGYEILRWVRLPASRRDFIRLGAVNAVYYDPATVDYCGVADPRRQGFALAARF